MINATIVLSVNILCNDIFINEHDLGHVNCILNVHY